MGLRMAVITSVDRDDLPDLGATAWVGTIRSIRKFAPDCKIEVLTPDFQGQEMPLARVIAERPDVFNHNVETVPRLYDFVRPGSRFERSVGVLREAKRIDRSMTTKSGLMLGLGERRDEVLDVLKRLRDAEVEIITIGQYLQPKREKLDVVEYVHPRVFDEYRIAGEELGFAAVFSGPFVRSSYMADVVATTALSSRA
jgi:lipoic acid synthetase